MANISNPKAGGSNRNINMPVEQLDSSSGTVEKGFVMASFLNTGSTNITVNGVALEPGASKTYPYVQGNSYGQLAWDASGGGEVLILVIY